MRFTLPVSALLLAAAVLVFGGCVWWTGPPIGPPANGATPTPSPTATATPIPDCEPSTSADGWIFVVFRDDVPGERAFEIVQEVGATIVPIMEMPLLDPPDGYLEVVAVPSPEQEQEYIALLEAYSEVVRALPDWPDCPPPE